jgi:hypothetical protein
MRSSTSSDGGCAARPFDKLRVTGAKRAHMSSTGLSKSGLRRFHDVVSGYVERRYVPGMVALVSAGDHGS